MKTIELTDIIPIFTADMIQARIKELADSLNKEYSEEVYIVCVLKGAVMFATDLVKHLKMPVKMEFIRLSSYGSDTESSGQVKAIDFNLPDLNGKNVIVIEDIIDTGYTAQFLTVFFKNNFRVKSYKFISLLDKRCRREVDVHPDMYGFDIDDRFLVGYGLDFDGVYRNLDYVGYVELG
ncbi:MAG: hypoxanthine phosphoribosyltransferase [Cyanobacteria bacterium RUI128]|nr:hypoxanthine phosphoribosyltransferase [Cyanobacteria bacterium RUI128]